MNGEKAEAKGDASLCHEARERLNNRENGGTDPAGPMMDRVEADASALVHELQVHQIELEMQNEELKRTKLEAEEALAKYANLYDFSPMGLFTLDKDKFIREINLAGAELLGTQRTNLMNRRFENYVAFKDRPAFNSFCNEACITEVKQKCELRLLKSTGETIHAYIECLATEKPAVKYRLAIVDVTEHKRMEEMLKRSEEKSRLLIEHAPSMIYEIDFRGPKFTSVNDAMCSALGYTREELLAMDPLDMLEGESKKIFQDRIHRYLAGEKLSDSIEYSGRAKDGHIVYGLLNISFTYEDGKPTGAVVVAHDITERKKMEEAVRKLNAELEQRVEKRTAELVKASEKIRAERQRFLDMLDTLPVIIDIIRPDCRVEWANRAYREALGDNQMPLCFVSQFGRDKPCEECQAFIPLQTGKPQHWEWTLPNGRTFDIHDFPFADADGLPVILEMDIDITERRKAEAELKDLNEMLEGINKQLQEKVAEHEKTEKELMAAKEAAEAAVKAKAAFLANMSHELRTPMNSIIGFTSLLLEEPLSPEYKDWLETMRVNGDALLALINDVLDFSKMERDKIGIELHPFNLRQCIEESLDLVSAKAAEKCLDLAYMMDSSVPEVIISDSGRLRQVLANLLSNAVKFTDSGDILVHISSKPEGALYELHFAVEDSGIGMPQDQMSKLFQPFSQIDTAPSRLTEGTGLGLAISKKLVELMGGKIWAESEEGKGSTFIFTIKAEVVPEDKGRKLPVGPQPKLAKRNVLIVDDSETMRRLLGHQAKSWGMMPLVVSLSYSAIDLIQKGVVPDVAIIDVGMPDLNGIVLAEKILKLRGDMPLIMLTSAGQRIPERLSAAALTKPIRPIQLYDVLTSVLGDRPAQRQDSTENRKGISPLRMLLAEDNISSQKITLRMLEKLGYRADVAANGVEVIEALERQPYDIVLMDIKMPEMDGFEATRQIRQRWPDDGPKIIAITAYALVGDKEKCLEAGMDGYISKPVKLAELAETLGRLSAVQK